MGNLLAYSGLTTKVKAMQSRLITPAQLQEMASLESVTACVEYLKTRIRQRRAGRTSSRHY